MNLDGDLAGTEFSGCLFIQQAGYDKRQNLTLVCRQRRLSKYRHRLTKYRHTAAQTPTSQDTHSPVSHREVSGAEAI
jgi:hypothetical protein